MVPLCHSDVLDANHPSLSLFFTSPGTPGSHTLAGFKPEDEHLGGKQRPSKGNMAVAGLNIKILDSHVCLPAKGPRAYFPLSP